MDHAPVPMAPNQLSQNPRKSEHKENKLDAYIRVSSIVRWGEMVVSVRLPVPWERQGGRDDYRDSSGGLDSSL
jgi:hypothetical protein